MSWMYLGVSILILVGIFFIIWGGKLTEDEHKKEEYIGNSTYYNASISQMIGLFLLSLLFKYIPFWLMRVFLILFGLAIITFVIFVIILGN